MGVARPSARVVQLPDAVGGRLCEIHGQLRHQQGRLGSAGFREAEYRTLWGAEPDVDAYAGELLVGRERGWASIARAHEDRRCGGGEIRRGRVAGKDAP